MQSAAAIINIDKLRGAVFASSMGDALAMPVHWYYDLGRLKRHFGKITGYEKSHYPVQTILSQSATGTGGRGRDTGEIVDKVICHGKRKYWARNTSYHYHHTLQPGENTLDYMVMRVLMRNLIKNQGVDLDDVSQSYIDFMTTPGSHNDVYASTAHRMFFRNLVTMKKKPADCPDTDHHNVDTIDGMINVIPIVLMGLIQNLSEKQVVDLSMDVLLRYRNAPNMLSYVKQYVHLCFAAYQSKDVPEFESRLQLKFSNFKHRSDPMTACYISSSFPALVHLVAKYSNLSIHEALLANANAGGECVARGICFGTVLGLLHGFDSIPENWITQLVANDELQTEVDNLIKTFSQKSDL